MTAQQWNDRAFALIKEQRWEEAVEAATEALSQEGQNAAAHFNMGQLGTTPTGSVLIRLVKDGVPQGTMEVRLHGGKIQQIIWP